MYVSLIGRYDVQDDIDDDGFELCFVQSIVLNFILDSGLCSFNHISPLQKYLLLVFVLLARNL